MASLLVNRARSLFSYSDLQGTTVDAMESGSGIPDRIRSRKKCIGISTGILGIVILFCIVASVHQSDDISLRNLPAAFSSASSGSGIGSVVDARRVSLSDTSHGAFYASQWNGSWINDVEFLYADSSGILLIHNSTPGPNRYLTSKN